MADLVGKEYCACEKPIPIQDADKKNIHCGECGKDIKDAPQEVKSLTWVVTKNLETGQVNIQGALEQLAEFYATVEVAKDIMREWNRLNKGYLAFQKVPPPKGSLLNFARNKK